MSSINDRRGQHLQGTSSELCTCAVIYSPEIFQYRSAVSGGYRFPFVFGMFRILMSARRMDLLTENYRGFSWCPYKNYATQTYNRHTNTQFGTMKILWCLKTSWDTENVTVDGSNIQHTYVPRHICVFSNL